MASMLFHLFQVLKKTLGSNVHEEPKHSNGEVSRFRLETKLDCFIQLDKVISDEDKKAFARDEYINTHFSLGLWIRNNWIYQSNRKDTMCLMSLFGSIDPDSLSSEIIKQYCEYLRGRSFE